MFQDIKFQWAGKTYTLPARKSLGAIALVENTITLQELAQYSKNGLAPRGKLAIAFGDLLRYCGADVENEDIYYDMFGDEGKIIENVGTAVATLMQLMIPPKVREQMFQGGKASSGKVKGRGEADPPPGNSSGTAAPASKSTSARRSGANGSTRRQTSGI